jgi:hypothetical protein
MYPRASIGTLSPHQKRRIKKIKNKGKAAYRNMGKNKIDFVVNLSSSSALRYY